MNSILAIFILSLCVFSVKSEEISEPKLKIDYVKSLDKCEKKTRHGDYLSV